MAKKSRVWDGTAWQELASAQTDLTGYPALATNQFGFRNKIINGDFRINQRVYVSAANLASGAYGFDRWKSNFTNTTLTFTSAPQGQSLTINSGGGLQQVIERANMPAGNYVLTFTGTATGRVYNSGGTAPSYAASPVTVTLDGSADVVVEFTASGGTATLQNVQLEAGSVASAFERRPIGTELELCQRYYQVITIENNSYSAMFGGGSTFFGSPISFLRTMRTAPSCSYLYINSTQYWVHSGVTIFSANSATGIGFNTTDSSVVMRQVRQAGGSTPTVGNFYIWEPSFSFLLSAEL